MTQKRITNTLVLVFIIFSTICFSQDTGLGFNFSNSVIIFDDFISWGPKACRGETCWQTYCSGGGSTITGWTGDSKNRPGVITVYSGPATTSYGCLAKDNDAVYFGGFTVNSVKNTGDVIYETAFQLDVLSDATNTYKAAIGFSSDMTCAIGASYLGGSGVEPTQKAWITYSHGLNSGKFQCETRTTASAVTASTTADSGVTVVADTWYTLKIIVANDASSVSFFIDYEGNVNDPTLPVCTILATIPSTGDTIGSMTPIYTMYNSAGTVSTRKMYVDYSYLRQYFDIQR